jgi:hypothetical protein
MKILVKILLLFLVTNLSAQNPDCSLYIKTAMINDIPHSAAMLQDQKIIDSLGRGIWLNFFGNNVQARLTIRLVDQTDCLPQEARIQFEFDDNIPLTFSISTRYECLNAGKIDFMDLDQNKPGLYQISQLRRFRYFKINRITLETNKYKLILPVSFGQKKFILNSMKCIMD